MRGPNDLAVGGAHEVEIELDPCCPSIKTVHLLRPLQLDPIPLKSGKGLAGRPGATREARLRQERFKVRDN